MNASLSAALVFLLLAGGWWLGRRRSRPFLRSTDTGPVVALNRAQIERLRERPAVPAEAVPLPPVRRPDSAAGPSAVQPPALPLQPRQRQARLRQLQAWLVGSREQRLHAIAECSGSSRRDVLPLLRRGLRDPDPAVMAAAAAAMRRFRGRSAIEPLGAAETAQRQRPATASACRDLGPCRRRSGG